MEHIDISKLRIYGEPFEDNEETRYYLQVDYDTTCQIEFECCRRCGIFANEYEFIKISLGDDCGIDMYVLFDKEKRSYELHIRVETLKEWCDEEVPLTTDEKESLVSLLKDEIQRLTSGKNKKDEIER